MSVAAVVELSQELHRLAVAGVGLARNDRRVAALLPALERSGEKVPVFARIAERTAALLAASKADAPGEFLQLNTLVGAVLKTQGRTEVGGELEPPPPSATASRRIPMRVLNELREGFHGGRPRMLDDAIECGWFGDARLAFFALDALGSDDAALANLAAEKLVPPYGKGIVPALLASLELSAKRPAARIVETVGRIDADSGAALARQILDPEAERVFELSVDGVTVSDEASAAALGLLGDGEADRGLLVDFLGAKRKALRVAALSRLLALGDADAEVHAVAMLEGSAAKVREAIESIPALSSDAVTAPVVARAQALVEALGTNESMSKEVKDAARLLSLFARSAPERTPFEAALALLERMAATRFWSDELHRGNTLATLFGHLIGSCPDERRKALARTTTSISIADAAFAAVDVLGPSEALTFLRLGDRDTVPTALHLLFSDGFGETCRTDDLPPPATWNAEWLELGLYHGLFGVVDYLWCLDPEAVVARTLAPRKIRSEALVISALIADPGCADALRRKLSPKITDHAHFDTLCAAIAGGERELALESVVTLPRHHGPDRLDTLHRRLVDHFSGTAA